MSLDHFATVRATIVDSDGRPVRVVTCPRFALDSQAGPGETIVEQDIPKGKKWDGGLVDDTPPPAPASNAVWNASEWRWVSWEERNAAVLRQIAALEQQQLRSTRELVLNRGNVAASRQRLTEIDDQIVALRAQLTA